MIISASFVVLYPDGVTSWLSFLTSVSIPWKVSLSQSITYMLSIYRPKEFQSGRGVPSEGSPARKATPRGMQLHGIVSAKAPSTQISCRWVRLKAIQASGFWCLNAAEAIHSEALFDAGARWRISTSRLHGLTDRIIITSSSKCALHRPEAGRVAFHN